MELVFNTKLLDSLVDAEELYQNAPCGYLSFLPDGTIIKANQTLVNWLGYSMEELLYKKKFTDLISKGAVLHFEMFFRPLINTSGVVNQLSYDILKKSGNTLPVFLSAVANKSDDGIVQAINATIYDISERKKYEQELLHSKRKADNERKRFEFLSDFIPEMIWTANAEGNVDYVNRRFLEYFNVDRYNLDLLLSRLQISDRRKLLRIWLNTIKTGNQFSVELPFTNKVGQREWHLLKGIPFREDDGTISKWFGSCTNIDSQIQSIRKRDEFINIASHEFKTPITSLKAYNQLLQRMELPAEAEKFVSRASVSLNSLQFLVSSLLDVSKIDSGQLVLNLSDFPIKELISDCIDLVNLSTGSHKTIAQFDGSQEIYVRADRQRVMQVLINLINNAVKYSPDANTVIVRLLKTSNLVKIEVHDFGHGIPAEKLDYIFDKYYRVSETRNNNKAPGLGLGLYIIQNIMKQHQSRIFVNSTLNEGSTFYFSLPVSSEQ